MPAEGKESMNHISGKRQQLLDFSLLFLLAAVLYGKMLGFGFQDNWDDNWTILYNDAVRGFSWHNIRTAFTTYVIGSYVPLQSLSFMLDHAIWGLNPGGYHATNILIHTVNSLLIYRLLFRWYADRLLCLVATLFFLIHPVQVESVGWISNRKTLLAMLFFLLAWEGYCRYREAGLAKARWWYYGATLTFFTFSLLSKSITVIMPGILVLYDFCFLRGDRRVRLMDKVPFFVIAGVIAAVTVIGFSTPVGASVPYHGGSFLATFYSMLPVFCRYMGMLVWPSHLSAVYAPTIHHSPDAVVVGAALLLGSVLLGGGWLFRRDRRFGFWVVFFFAGLFPVSQIVPTLSMMADRYLYFPMIGVAALAGSGAVFLREHLAARHRAVLCCLLVLPLVALSVASFRRALVWHDPLILWSDAAAKEPMSDRAWELLGETQMFSGRTAEARQAYERGHLLNPANTEILQGLGTLYTETGELDKGYRLLKKLLEIKPTYVTGWASLGSNYQKRGDFGEAEKAYKRALGFQPDAMQVVSLLGDLALLQGRLDLARTYYVQLESRTWDGPGTAYHLACVESRAGRTEESLAWMEKALERGFDDFVKLSAEPQLSELRSDPRFLDLITKYKPK